MLPPGRTHPGGKKFGPLSFAFPPVNGRRTLGRRDGPGDRAGDEPETEKGRPPADMGLPSRPLRRRCDLNRGREPEAGRCHPRRIGGDDFVKSALRVRAADTLLRRVPGMTCISITFWSLHCPCRRPCRCRARSGLAAEDIDSIDPQSLKELCGPWEVRDDSGKKTCLVVPSAAPKSQSTKQPPQ